MAHRDEQDDTRTGGEVLEVGIVAVGEAEVRRHPAERDLGVVRAAGVEEQRPWLHLPSQGGVDGDQIVAAVKTVGVQATGVVLHQRQAVELQAPEEGAGGIRSAVRVAEAQVLAGIDRAAPPEGAEAAGEALRPVRQMGAGLRVGGAFAGCGQAGEQDEEAWAHGQRTLGRRSTGKRDSGR